jgi:hypothetical protein
MSSNLISFFILPSNIQCIPAAVWLRRTQEDRASSSACAKQTGAISDALDAEMPVFSKAAHPH